MSCWCGYLFGVRCRLFAYGPALQLNDTASHSCLIYIQTGFTYLVLAYPGYSGKKGCRSSSSSAYMHTNTYLRAICPGLPRWAGTREVKPIWILLKQETMSGSGISWAICKSAPRSRPITTPAPHHSVFLQARCPSCRPTNSVKALKAR